jgi:hypothetical protein
MFPSKRSKEAGGVGNYLHLIKLLAESRVPPSIDLLKNTQSEFPTFY